MSLPWLPYVAKMLASREVRDLLRDLWRLSNGNIAESRKAVRRMRDQGFVLHDAEEAIDADLAALEERQKRERGRA